MTVTTKGKIVLIHAPQVRDTLVWEMFHLAVGQEATPPKVYELVYFDFPAGKRKTWRSWQPARGKGPAQAPDEVQDLQKVRILREDQQLGPARPTFLAVYDWIKAQTPGSIESFHLFSHGWNGEPVIWYESREGFPKTKPDLERHPNDTEPRRRDFHGRNPLAGDEGRRFAAAFACNAVVKLWGCEELPQHRQWIRKYAANGSADLREAILDGIEDTYAMKLARLLGITVWAAPYGWGTNPGSNLPYRGVWPPDLQKHRWWTVLTFDSASQRVFRDDFGAKIDPTLYVGYHPWWLTRARQEDAAKALETLSPKALQCLLEQQIEELKAQIANIGS